MLDEFWQWLHFLRPYKSSEAEFIRKGARWAVTMAQSTTGKSLESSNIASLAGNEYALEQHVNHLLRKALQRATEIFQYVMGGFDVTPTQFAALIKLQGEGECSQNVLGRLTAMDPATILGVVARLKRRGLVESRLDPNDGRRILLCLSDEGEALVQEMKEVAAKVTSETLSPLTKSEAQSFIRLLRKLA